MADRQKKISYRSLSEKYSDYQHFSIAVAYHLKNDFRCERVSIFLKGRGRRFLTVVAQGLEGMTIDVKPGEGLTGKAIQKRAPIIVNDALHDSRSLCRVRDHYTGFQTRSLLAVPGVGILGRPVGAFLMINSMKGGFADSDKERAGKIAWLLRKIKGIAPGQVENIWTARVEKEIADESYF